MTYVAQDHNGSHDNLFTGVNLHKLSFVSDMYYKRPYDTQMAQYRSALGCVIVPGASNRDKRYVKELNVSFLNMILSVAVNYRYRRYKSI